MEFERYPMVMNHPAFQPARKIADAIAARPPGDFGKPEQWAPVKWPAVTVESESQEEEYKAKGYVAAGTPNPAAFSTAKASPFVPGRTSNEWPKIVNGVLMQDPNARPPGPIEYPKYLTPPDKGEAVLVQNAAEEDALIALWTAPEEPKKSEKRAR